jgi:hypothetical protein
VRADVDEQADFTGYRTFKLASCQPPDSSCASLTPLLADRIARALADELQTRGLRPDSATPDLIVSFAAATATKADLVQPSGDPPWGGLGGDIWPDEVRQATVMLSFVDARTNRTVWTAQARTDQQNPTSAAVVRQAVAAALERYPVPRS